MFTVEESALLARMLRVAGWLLAAGAIACVAYLVMHFRWRAEPPLRAIRALTAK